jgi:hypothetical protein
MQAVDIIRIGEMKLAPVFEVAAFLKTDGSDSKSDRQTSNYILTTMIF